jgi:hypothetical protein
MKRSPWNLILCAGVCAAALVATRSVGAERSSADERQPVLAVCVTDVAEDAVAEDAAEAMCGRCGDGYCNPSCGETATSCPKDCGATPAAEATCGKCGDGYCNPSCGETATSCPKDCGATPS